MYLGIWQKSIQNLSGKRKVYPRSQNIPVYFSLSTVATRKPKITKLINKTLQARTEEKQTKEKAIDKRKIIRKPSNNRIIL